MGKHSWGEGELFHYKMKLKKNTQMMFIIFIILKTTTVCEKVVKVILIILRALRCRIEFKR